MASPEIRRGDFLYHDTLFVDVGNNKRHPRASASDLKNLLLPKGAAPKDEVAHWYEAQLIHYGLQRTKDKNTAKVRLTSAISAKALTVPAYIAQMEADMKREYAAAIRKAKGAGKKENAEASGAKGKKRKADEEEPGPGARVKMKMSRHGDIEFEIDRRGGGGNEDGSKKKKAASAATKKSTPKPKSAAKSTASATKPTTRAPASSPTRPSPTTSTPRPKQTARRSRPFTYPSPSTRPPPSSPQRTYDHTPSSFHPHTVDSDEDNDPPPPYSTLPYTHTHSPSPPPTNKNVVQISGTYSLSASTRPPHELSLRIDHPTHTLWGTFHFGPKFGVLKLSDISGLASRETKTFGWRAEDENSQNKLRFGRGCDGSIQFDGAGGVRGRFAGLMYGEDVECEGRLVGEGELDVGEVREWWEGFPDRAYGRS
jgi:hypothetical protein